MTRGIDLDGDGAIGFGDFLIFVNSYRNQGEESDTGSWERSSSDATGVYPFISRRCTGTTSLIQILST